MDLLGKKQFYTFLGLIQRESTSTCLSYKQFTWAIRGHIDIGFYTEWIVRNIATFQSIHLRQVIFESFPYYGIYKWFRHWVLSIAVKQMHTLYNVNIKLIG